MRLKGGKTMEQSNVWNFIGVSKTIDNEAERLLDQLFEKVFVNIQGFSGLSYKEFRNIEDMVDNAKHSENSYSYFWSWLENQGIVKLKKIASTRFYSDDETLDLLEYRMFVLEQDMEGNIVHNLIESLADGISEIYKFSLSSLNRSYEWNSIVSLDNSQQKLSVTTLLDNTSGVCFS